MASEAFDKLWDDAQSREGELMAHAAELAKTYKITSALAAIKLARALAESGQPFFECCEAIYKEQEEDALHRLKRKLRLSERDMKFIKQLLDEKAKKG